MGNEGHEMGVSSHLRVPAALPQGKQLLYMGLGGPENQYGCCRTEKNRLLLLVTEPRPSRQ
jgi:hypothetical protein